MRIRTKLILLFVSVSLAPLVIQGVNDRMSVRALGKRVGDQAAQELIDRARAELSRSARASAAMLSARAQYVEMVVANQAQQLTRLYRERAITGFSPEPPPHIGMPLTNRDFDAAISEASGAEEPRYGLSTDPNYYFIAGDNSRTPILVSWDQPVLVPAPGLTEEQIAVDAPLLAAWAGTLEGVRDADDELILGHFTCTTEGLHLSLPGKGGYPGLYDGSERSWFQAALNAGGDTFTWELVIDAPTRQLRLTCSTPVLDPDGTVRAVTACDVSLLSMLDLVALPREATRSTSASVVGLRSVPNQFQRGDLLADVESFDDSGASWSTPPRRPRLQDRIGEDAAGRIIEELAAGRGGSKEISDRGVASLIAFYPVGSDGEVGLLVTEDLAGVLDRATAARDEVNATAMNLIRESAIVGFLALGATIVIAALSSRKISEPVMELADAAGRIAEGDLDTRVQVTGADEFHRLAHAFNGMAPKLADRLRMRDALEVAEKVQQNLLPSESPEVPGYDIAGFSDYCDETGGDYFDYIPSGSVTAGGTGRIGLAIGDVTGHGIGAALLMTTTRASLRHAAVDHEPIERVLGGVNRVLEADTSDGRFMTLLFLRLDPQDHTLRWVSAGHDPAIIYTPGAGGSFAELTDASGVPLGVVPEYDYPASAQTTLSPGQIVVAGTDGIWEARNINGAMFGKEKLKALIAEHAEKPAAEIARAVVDAVHEHHMGVHQQDDITVLVVKRVP